MGAHSHVGTASLVALACHAVFDHHAVSSVALVLHAACFLTAYVPMVPSRASTRRVRIHGALRDAIVGQGLVACVAAALPVLARHQAALAAATGALSLPRGSRGAAGGVGVLHLGSATLAFVLPTTPAAAHVRVGALQLLAVWLLVAKHEVLSLRASLACGALSTLLLGTAVFSRS